MSRQHSTVNGSKPLVTFTDYDNRDAPYDGRALRVALVSDVLFLHFGKLTEETDHDRFEHDDAHSIGVDAEALYQTLGVMLRREDREVYERAREGSLPADHPGLVPATIITPTVATRRRA